MYFEPTLLWTAQRRTITFGHVGIAAALGAVVSVAVAAVGESHGRVCCTANRGRVVDDGHVDMIWISVLRRDDCSPGGADGQDRCCA